MKFEFIEHTADIKFRAYGKSLDGVFENSALAMFASMYSGRVKAANKKKISVSGKDFESLLYNFLEELLVLLDSDGFFVSGVKVEIDEEELKLDVVVFGDDAKKYPISLDVKAVTYSEMFVKEEKGKWICQVVLDV